MNNNFHKTHSLIKSFLRIAGFGIVFMIALNYFTWVICLSFGLLIVAEVFGIIEELY